MKHELKVAHLHPKMTKKTLGTQGNTFTGLFVVFFFFALAKYRPYNQKETIYDIRSLYRISHYKNDNTISNHY